MVEIVNTSRKDNSNPFYIYNLQRLVSDHYLIVLKCFVKDLCPKPFKFMDIWQIDPRFKVMIKRKWSEYIGSEESLVAKRKVSETETRYKEMEHRGPWFH